MERQFQRADFEDLMGDDALLDGTELSCGFVRIEASGIYSTYRPARGEEPWFDTNVFKREDLVLPFRFTLEQFKAFCAWHRAFKWDVIDLEFTNSFCSWHPLFRGKASDSFNYPPDDDALLELKGRNQSSAVLVLGILGIADADEYFVCKLREFNDQSEAETMVEVAANEKPEPPAPPVVAADSSGGVEPDAGQLAASQPQATTLSSAPVVAVGASGGTATLWTTKRKEAARAMMNEQRGQGVKAFAANTAAAFSVTSTRLREVLNDKPKKAPAKKPKGIWGV